MSRTAVARTQIAIVGAGNFASALALALHHADYAIDEIVTRDRATSLRRAKAFAGKVRASAVVARRARLSAEVVWFCVPDREIAGAAKSLKSAATWKGKVALHSSGALTSDELLVLRAGGAKVASVHPMMTFVRGSTPSLAGVPFAIEGDPTAVRVGRTIVSDLGGTPFSISKEQKNLYHAWGMFSSPLLTALLAVGENVAIAAGLSKSAARERVLPILRQTLSNYERSGAPAAFSGPIARGDVATVEKHLKTLQHLPGVRKAYVALALAALRDLPAKNRKALQKILTE
jgi:predicted short-subunit dehydrogenase-like oxidoreductase (DUF2520 family)